MPAPLHSNAGAASGVGVGVGVGVAASPIATPVVPPLALPPRLETLPASRFPPLPAIGVESSSPPLAVHPVAVTKTANTPRRYGRIGLEWCESHAKSAR